MAQSTLNRILEEIGMLDPHELRQVQRAVETRLSPPGYSPDQEALLQALLADGLVTQVRPRRHAPSQERPLVHIGGKPLSESIVQERR